MPARPPTMWSFLWFGLKWNLLLMLLIGACLMLAQSSHPWLTLLPPVLFGVFFVRDLLRRSRGLRGRIVRRVGGYQEHNVRPTLASTVITVAVVGVFVFYGFYVL